MHVAMPGRIPSVGHALVMEWHGDSSLASTGHGMAWGAALQLGKHWPWNGMGTAALQALVMEWHGDGSTEVTASGYKWLVNSLEEVLL